MARCSWEVRAKLAVMEHISEGELEYLLYDLSPPVRAAALCNPRTSLRQAKEVLAELNNAWLRLRVAEQARPEIAGLLERDPKMVVRRQLARRPDMPKALLRRLRDDSRAEVRSAAEVGLGLIGQRDAAL